MPDAEATFRGQLPIMRMKGSPTILGILYSVYAVLSVCLYSVSTHDNGKER